MIGKSTDKRDAHGRLLPGHGGLRQKGAERVIREIVEARGGGWADLVTAMLNMALAENVKAVDRQRAIEWLFDRVYGKPVAPSTSTVTATVTAGGPSRVPRASRDLSIEQLRAMRAIAAGAVVPAGILDAPSSVRVIDTNAEPHALPAGNASEQAGVATAKEHHGHQG